MPAPSLFILSCKKVALWMRIGKYDDISIKFPPKISEQLLKELDVKRIELPSPGRALNISNKLLLTKLDMRKRLGVSRTDMLFLSQQDHLESLELGMFRHLLACVLDGHEYIAELKSCISEQSRKSLRHLGLTTGDFNSTHFVPQLFRMFPNLTSLNLHDSRINVFGFIAIHNNYPNLTRLDVCMDRLFNVLGISRLRHLEHLTIGCSHFEGCNGLDELCAMPSLRVLDISDPENNRDNRLFEEVFGFMKPGSFPRVEVLDLSGNLVTLRKYQTIVEALPALRHVILLATPLAFEKFNDSSPRVLNCATLALLRDSLNFLRGKETRIWRTIRDVLHNLGLHILESTDVKLKNAFVRDICEILLESGAGFNRNIDIWLVSCQALNLLVSFDFYPTSLEVQALSSIYFAFKGGFHEQFWRNTDIHYIMWKVLRDLCANRTFAENADPRLVREAIRALASPQIHPRAVACVLNFFKVGCDNYPRAYVRFLEFMRGVAIESNDFCHNYARFNLVNKFYLRWNVRRTSEKVQLAHLKILKLVVLNLRQKPEIRAFCQRNVVGNLLGYITPDTLTVLGHYAFAILWTLQNYHEFADRRQSVEFDKVKERRPLEATIVWEIVDCPEEIDLIRWAPPVIDDFTAF